MRYFFLLLPALLFAKMLQPGDPVVPTTLKDQFGRTHDIGRESCWIITWDRGTTHDANAYFSSDSTLLDQKICRMIVDVSQTPSGIMSLFVLPRMKEYKHTILLSYDEQYNLTLPYQEGHITLLSINNGKVEAIEFSADSAMLEELLADH